MAKSPAVILFDANGVAMAVEDGLAIPVGTRALLAAGSDGVDAHVLRVDASGRPTVVGAGAAGAPAGGVVSIQGVAGGVAVPITGSVSVTNASVSANDAPAPGSSTQVGGSDGTNLQAVRVFDADTGGAGEYILGVGLRKAASGGSVEAGTATDPLRVDPTGTTTQPISAASLPLPTGAASEATLSTRLADATFTARINTFGQKTMAGSTPVVLASDQSPFLVTANIGTTNGLALDATLTGGTAQTRITDGVSSAAVKAGSTAPVAADPALVVTLSPNSAGSISNPSVGSNDADIPTFSTQFGGSDGTNLQPVRVFDGDTGAGTEYVLGATLRKSASGGTVEAGTATDPLRTDPTGTTTQPISAVSLPLPAGAATDAILATRLAEATFTARINTLGQKAMAASTPVVLASDQTAIPITDNAGSLTVDGAVTANIGTTNGLALDATLTGGTQRTKITDGTSNAAVKAASTPAVASDPALVVAFSPNNTIATSNASVGTNNAGVPSSSTQFGGTDGTNLQAVRVFDGDTGAGTQYVLGTTLRKSAAGGTVEAGTATDPLRVDPTGTTTQPISAAALPLPTGAATEATLATRLADATFTSRINTLGAKTSAASTPVVLASDQTAIPITDNAGSLTVDGAVTANIGTTNGLALDATLTSGTQRTRITDGTSNAAVKAASAAAVAADPALVVAISPNNTVPISAASLPLPAGAATDATLATRLADATFTARINTLGAKSSAASTPVVLASDQAPLPITDNGGSLTVDGTVTANIGTTNGVALDATLTGGTQRTKITDGTSNAAVKAASTAAAAADPALVVAVSPNSTVPITASSLPLPAGAATDATLATRLADATFTGRINTFGQKAMAASTPVVLASDQTAIPITDNAGSLTVDGAVTANIGTTNGLALDATLTGGTQRTKITDGTINAAVKAASTAAAAADPALVVAISPNNTVPVSAASLPLPAGAATDATLATRLADATFTARINTFGAKSSAASTPVVLASDQAPLPITDNGGSLTVDGAVAITSVIPGVGPTNLGKAEDSAAVSGDTGVAMFGVYQPDTVGVSASSIGDYATLNIDDKGRLRVSPGGVIIIDTFDSASGITAVNTDVANIAVSTNHVRGTGAVSFDIVNSAANSPFALIQKTIPALNLANLATGITFIQLLAFIPSLANVANVVIRLGTDANNYNSWSVAVANSSVVGSVWQSFRAVLGSCNASVGAGWDLSAVTYFAVGLELSNVNATLAGVVVDSLWAIGGQVHGSDINSEISTVVSTAKVDLSKLNGKTIDADIGGSTSATLRVVNATDDPNLSAINANQTSGLQQTKITNGTNTAAVDATGRLQVASTASTSNQTNVAGSATTVVLLAANAARKGATIFNDSASILYVKLGSTASASSFSTRLVGSAYYEVPFGYMGTVDGIWASATGTARITEFT